MNSMFWRFITQMMKKIVINSCTECKFYYDPVLDPYPDVGWRMNECTKLRKILWKDEEKSIPIWCPLPDDN